MLKNWQFVRWWLLIHYGSYDQTTPPYVRPHEFLPLQQQTAPTTMISAKDITDYNYEGEWESTKAQHQDYDSLISISPQNWSIDFLPESITVKRDMPR